MIPGMAISKSRICDSNELFDFLNLGHQHYTGVFPKTKDELVPIGELKLQICLNCKLVQLAECFDKSAMYGSNYGYQSGLNDSMREHLKNIADFLKHTITLHDGMTILDIGSNDGTFLSFFQNMDIKRIGIDPTISKFNQMYDKEIIKIPDFFNADVFNSVSKNRANLITSISMTYDLEDPVIFAKDISQCLEEDGYWFFEQSYLGLMIEKMAYDTVCHEHIEYYSAKSLAEILARAGFVVRSFVLNDTNGGSIAILASKRSSINPDHSIEFLELLQKEFQISLNSTDYLSQFANDVSSHRDNLIEIVNGFIKKGMTVAALGASTKGNVLLQYCEFTSLQISLIGEINSDKFGSFTPGSKIPIVSEDELFESNPSVIIVLPWHFKSTFIKKTEEFRKNGGIVLFPLPNIELVSNS